MTTAYRTHATELGNDPLHYDTPLPFGKEYFPMGRSLRINTNSEDVLDIADAIWSAYCPLSNERGLHLCVEVDFESRHSQLAVPVMRARQHLVTMNADAQNFVCADLKTGFAFAHFTKSIVNNAAHLRYHFLEPLAYLLIGSRYFTYLHAACVSLNDRGIVLCGESGAGKTCLAFAVARKGWTFHSGDATAILLSDPFRLAGRPYEVRFRHSARLLFPELNIFPRVMRPNGS